MASSPEKIFSVNFDNYDFSGKYGNERVQPWKMHTRKFVPGRKGGALNLSARKEALIYTLPFFNSPAGTVECFLKLHPNAKADRRYIFTIYQGNNDYLMRARLDGQTVNVDVRSGNKAGGTSGGGAFNADIKSNWLHFAVSWRQTKSNSTEFFIYMNGLRLAHLQMLAAFKPNLKRPYLILGGWLTKNIPFIGMIDEFIVSDSARYTQERIPGVTVGYNLRELHKYAENLSKKLKSLTLKPEVMCQLRLLVSQTETEIAKLEKQGADPNIVSSFIVLKGRLADIERKINWYVFWSKTVGSYFAVLPVDSMVKYASDWKSVKRDDSKLRVFSAGNEYSIMQVLLIPNPDRNEKRFKVELSPFCDASGNKAPISTEMFQVDAFHLRYLKPPKACAEFLHPLKEQCLSLTDELYKPLFLIFYTPKGVKAGTYTAELTVSSGGQERKLPLKIDVYGFSLPVISRLKTAFGFSTRLISNYYNIDQNSERFRRLKKAYLENMLRHRVSPKTAIRGYTREDITFLAPLAVKTSEGKWKMEFSSYEQQLDKLLALGLNTIMVGNRNWVPKHAAKGRVSFFYFDEADRKYKSLSYDFMSPEMLKHGAWYIKNWYDFIKRKGLEKMAYTYVFDEPNNPEQFQKIARVCNWLKTVVPGLPHMMTALPPSAEYDAIDIWCPLEPGIENNKNLQAQLRKGKKLWSYVCCAPTPPAMNFFIQQRGITHRAIFWHAYKFGSEGFLYYELALSMSPWRGKVMQDPRWRQMPDTEGDGFLVYPGTNGPVNTVRFEYIRQGIQDVDYFLMLKDLAKKLPADNPLKKQAEKLLAVPDVIVSSATKFSFDSDLYRNHRHKVARMIEKVKKELNR